VVFIIDYEGIRVLVVKLITILTGLFALFLSALILIFQGTAQELDHALPATSKSVVTALNSVQWRELEDGMEVIRAITESGIIITGYRLSPDRFKFSVVTQLEKDGSRAKDVGEREGGVLVTNAGFFAQRASGSLYPIGYLRIDGDVRSKGWAHEGGVATFNNRTIKLTPTHQGIPQNEFDALQSRPMLIEPGGKWAMASNIGEIKNRTVLCTQANGDVVLAVVSRVGMSLFEAGWIMRSPKKGGFFDCDAALALDGGRSTQVWYAGDQAYSYSGITPVHNFLVISNREE